MSQQMSIVHSPHASEPQETVNVSTVGVNLAKDLLRVRRNAEQLTYAASAHSQAAAQAAASAQKPYLRFIHT